MEGDRVRFLSPMDGICQKNIPRQTVPSGAVVSSHREAIPGAQGGLKSVTVPASESPGHFQGR
jgi:hypothetical protein